MPGPELTVAGGRGSGDLQGDVRGVVLMLHGGQKASREPVSATSTSWLRMRVLAYRLAGPAAAAGAAVVVLRNRVRGWNVETGDPAEPDPVVDGRWALEQVAVRYGAVPVVLVGHSMGGRAVCRLADSPGVRGVVALAPWLPDGEPVDAARSQRLVLAHGGLDRWTSPRGSVEWSCRARAAGASVARIELPMVGHFMFAKGREWNAVVRHAALGLLGVGPVPAAVTAAFAAPGDGGLRLAVRDLEAPAQR